MRGDGLCLAGALEHEQLREDGDRLEPDREGPCELEQRVLVVEEQRSDHDRHEEVVEPEGVERSVLRRPEVSALHERDERGRCGSSDR